MLLVGHDREGRELLTGVLRYCGALVTAVASAAEALAVMTRIKADVLVTEIALPDADGYWLLGNVRALKPEDGGVVPAVGLGAGPAAVRLETGRASGFDACLSLPLDPWELCRVISNLMMAS